LGGKDEYERASQGGKKMIQDNMMQISEEFVKKVTKWLEENIDRWDIDSLEDFIVENLKSICKTNYKFNS